MYYILVFRVLPKAYMAEWMDISDLKVTEDTTKGIRYNASDLSIVLPKTRGVVTDYIPSLHHIDIVSEDIKNAFVEFDAARIECYPVEVKRKYHKPFFFINILDNINCLDIEKSGCEEILPNTKVFTKINRLVLDEQKIAGRHFFRIQHHDSPIVISEAFKNKLESLQSPVLKFIPLTEYTYELGKIDWSLYD
jgi:hypothetical protein